MQQLILMARSKAQRLSDDSLAEHIRELESGKRKLHALDERGKRLDVAPLILQVFKREQAERKKHDAGATE